MNYTLSHLVSLLMIISGFLVSTRSTAQEKVIDLGQHWEDKGDYPLSKLGNSIEYIPLETTPACVIGPAYKYQYKLIRDTIYLTGQEHPIYVFDRHGKFVRTIGFVGQGPVEFTEITSYAINQNNNTIWISNRQLGKILIYTTSGVFVQEFKGWQGSYILFNNSDGGVSCFFRSFRQEASNNEIKEFGIDSMIVNRIPLYHVENYVEHRKYVRRSTISVLNRELSIIELPSLEEHILREGVWNPGWKFTSGSGDIIKIRQSQNHLFIQCANPIVHQFIVEKGSGNIFICSFGINAMGPDLVGAFNDLDGGLSFWPKFITADGDLVCMYEAYDLISFANGQTSSWGGKPPKMSDEFRDFTKKLSIDDNPVIAIVRQNESE